MSTPGGYANQTPLRRVLVLGGLRTEALAVAERLALDLADKAVTYLVTIDPSDLDDPAVNAGTVGTVPAGLSGREQDDSDQPGRGQPGGDQRDGAPVAAPATRATRTRDTEHVIDLRDRPDLLIERLVTAAATDTLLIDDVTGWLAGRREPGRWPARGVDALADAVRDTAATVVLVSRDAGLSGPPTLAGPDEAPIGLLAAANAALAEACDAVSLVVARHPLWVKPAAPAGGPAAVGAWPAIPGYPATTPARAGADRVTAGATTERGRVLPLRAGMRLPLPDEDARADVRDRLARLDVPGRGLVGMDDVVAFAAAVQGSDRPVPFARPHLLLLTGAEAAGRAAGADAAEMARWAAAARTGQGALALLAAAAGASVAVVDTDQAVPPAAEDGGDAGGTATGGDAGGTATGGDASGTATGGGGAARTGRTVMTEEQLAAALELGVRLVDAAVDSGVDLLVLAATGAGAETAAAGVIAAETGDDVTTLLPRVLGGPPDRRRYDDLAWMARCVALRDSLYRLYGRAADGQTVLRTVGGTLVATATAVLLAAAARRTPVLIDGPVGVAAALAARNIAGQVPHWLLLPDHGRIGAVRRGAEVLGLTPFLDLGTDLGEGTRALSALPLIQSALHLSLLEFSVPA